MIHLFLEICNMSITTSWLILAILILRFLLKKAPKSVIFSLWILVGIKLISPITFESIYSFIPSTNTIQLYSGNSSAINSGIDVIDNLMNPIISKDVMTMITSTTLIEMMLFVGTLVWIIGMASMLIHSILSYEKLQKKVEVSLQLKDEVFICDHIASPFILGVKKPKIYLPSHIDEGYVEAVLAHEYTHLQRKDHVWKMLGYLLLSLHWFNPFVWIAFILFTCDMETSCDETTIKYMNGVDKKNYCSALVSLSEKNHLLFTYPLAFGEIGVKERVKHIVNYKKPTTLIIIVTILLCFFTIVGFMSNPLNYDLKITHGPNTYKYDVNELSLGFSRSLSFKNQEGSVVDFYGPHTYLWRLYDKMDIYSLYGSDGLTLKSVEIITENGTKYKVYDSARTNGIILKEKDNSITFIHWKEETNQLVRSLHNVKEIILIE